MLQETKKHPIDKRCFVSFRVGRNKDWVFSSLDGSVLICWKADLFDTKAIEHRIYSLSIKISNRDSGFSWWLSCIYGPPTDKVIEEFWINQNVLGNFD